MNIRPPPWRLLMPLPQSGINCIPHRRYLRYGFCRFYRGINGECFVFVIHITKKQRNIPQHELGRHYVTSLRQYHIAAIFAAIYPQVLYAVQRIRTGALPVQHFLHFALLSLRIMPVSGQNCITLIYVIYDFLR